MIHAVAGIGKPFADLRRFGRPRRGKHANPGAIMAMLGLPLVGGALFVALFAAADPLIAQALAADGRGDTRARTLRAQPDLHRPFGTAGQLDGVDAPRRASVDQGNGDARA